MRPPLHGVRVLDLTRIVAGPWCAQTLADMGAMVYKVEKPGDGDDTRRMGPFLHDAQGRATAESATYLACNRGKQSITVDIAQPQGAELIRRLAARCDVLIENHKVGNLARYGLDAHTLRADHPGLIYCSITGFGQTGPLAPRAAYDFVMQGASGLMCTNGEPHGPPLRTAIPVTDIATGLYATIAILGALRQRDHSGQGQHIDMAMLDAAVAINGHLALGYLMTGQQPPRLGNGNPIAAPADVYRCADGELILSSGNNSQFAALARALGQPGWTSDPRFVNNAQRVAHRAELNAAIQAAVACRHSDELLAQMHAAGVPSGPIHAYDQVFADAQVQHRGLAQSLPHSLGVPVPSLRSPVRLRGMAPLPTAPPTLGEHTAQVLAQELGLDAQALQALRAAGVV